MLETPKGDLIAESAIVAQFAMDMGKGKGLMLWPSEGKENDQDAATESAKHRLFMIAFDKFLPVFFPVLMTLFKDEEKINALK